MCYISLIVVDTSEINVGWVVTYSNSFWSFARDAFKIANDKRHQIRAHLHALLKVIRAKFDRVIALKQTAESNLNITPQTSHQRRHPNQRREVRLTNQMLHVTWRGLSPGRGEAGGYFCVFLIEACRLVLLILTLLQTKKCYLCYLPCRFSLLALKIQTHFQIWLSKVVRRLQTVVPCCSVIRNNISVEKRN